MSWRAVLLVGGLAVACTVVLGQPFGGGRRGPRAGGGRGFGGRVQYGEITDLNPERHYIQIRSALDGSDQVVVVTEDTRILQDEAIQPADLQVGDTVVVTGVPLEVEARSIRVSPPEEEAQEPAEEPAEGETASGAEPESDAADETDEASPAPEANPTEETEGRTPEPEGEPDGETGEAEAEPTEGTDQEPTEPAAPEQEGPPPANATLTGVVVGTDPLCVEVAPGLVVRVKAAEDVEVSKAGLADFSVFALHTEIAAVGQRDMFGLLEADVIRVGGSLMAMVGELMRGLRGTGGGFMRGGGGGRPGMGMPPMMSPMGFPGGAGPLAPGGPGAE